MLDKATGYALGLTIDHAADAAHAAFGPFDYAANLTFANARTFGLRILDRFDLDRVRLRLCDMYRAAADERAACRSCG